jgi:hypothetical protein
MKCNVGGIGRAFRFRVVGVAALGIAVFAELSTAATIAAYAISGIAGQSSLEALAFARQK